MLSIITQFTLTASVLVQFIHSTEQIIHSVDIQYVLCAYILHLYIKVGRFSNCDLSMGENDAKQNKALHILIGFYRS